MVRAGSFYRARDADPNLEEFAVSKIIMHPSYLYPNYYNDIALLKLATPITYRSANIQPICLPPANKEYFGVNATVAGWGWLNENRNRKKNVALNCMPFFGILFKFSPLDQR